MGVGLPSAPRWHSLCGGDLLGRHKGRLRKATEVIHDLLVEVASSKARHCMSYPRPFLDVAARLKLRESELVGFVLRMNGDYGVRASVMLDHPNRGGPINGE